MKSPIALLLLPVAALLFACGKPAAETQTAPATPSGSVVAVPAAAEQLRDVHSFAEPEIARVTHVDLDLAADFAKRRLSGTATLKVEAEGDEPILTLDTRGLRIESVTDGRGKALPFTLGEEVEFMGAPLRITIGDARKVTVQYHTRPEAEALQWLEPAQTAGKRKPYLYSQGQATLTRSWVPTQDSPGIKQTWSARITVPADLTAVMSAEMLGPEPGKTPGTRTWGFRMEQPVAPYLIALAVGDLAFQKMGERTGVWTEPSMLQAAAWEFADTEKMVEAAEALYGPYLWDRYDLLVMPPSFPFGGMENPRLTFVTPTVIAGDRSLVSLIAHELAHSWSGNLVTNATWADFWLNEGFTTYFQDRIMEAVYGEEFATMQMDLSWDEMQAEIQNLGGSGSPETKLHIDLKGRDADDGMTSIPYEKGAVFLRTMEATVGRERWDEYLRGYFDRFAFQSQTSAGFLADLREHLVKDDAELEARLQLDTWVYAAGLPENAVHRRSVVLERVDKDAEAFVAGNPMTGDPAKWSTHERVRFLNRLPRELSVERLESLRKMLDLDNQKNSEVTYAWLRIAIANHYDAAVPQLERFLSSLGRRKFVLPLFTDLVEQGEWGRAHAGRIYARTRPGYHSVTSGRVDAVMQQAGPGG